MKWVSNWICVKIWLILCCPWPPFKFKHGTAQTRGISSISKYNFANKSCRFFTEIKNKCIIWLTLSTLLKIQIFNQHRFFVKIYNKSLCKGHFYKFYIKIGWFQIYKMESSHSYQHKYVFCTKQVKCQTPLCRKQNTRTSTIKSPYVSL